MVNCMTLRSSHAIFPLLADKLKAGGGQNGLQRFLSAPGPAVWVSCHGTGVRCPSWSWGGWLSFWLSFPRLLVLDEMDQLDSKAQDVLYTIFEWPYLRNSRLCLIGIANALDLTDRILPRLQARPHCRPQLLHFPPYSKEELVAIVQDRLAQVRRNSRSKHLVWFLMVLPHADGSADALHARLQLAGSWMLQPCSSAPERCRRYRAMREKPWTSAGRDEKASTVQFRSLVFYVGNADEILCSLSRRAVEVVESDERKKESHQRDGTEGEFPSGCCLCA